MKRLICVISIVLGMAALAPAPTRAVADTQAGSVTAAGQGFFAAPAALGSVELNGVELGTGVFIEPDGTAAGAFNAVLLGRSALGQAQQITIDGKVSAGTITPDGRANFSGLATVDLGGGTPPQLGVPFSVTAAADSLILVIDSTTLPAARLTTGGVTVE